MNLHKFAALSKCFVAVGNIEGVVGSKHQVPLPARGLISEVPCGESGKKGIEGGKIAGSRHILTGLVVQIVQI